MVVTNWVEHARLAGCLRGTSGSWNVRETFFPYNNDVSRLLLRATYGLTEISSTQLYPLYLGMDVRSVV